MDQLRQHLKQEFLARTARNEKYSLRAFAQMLGLSHATLSGMLNGKRSITITSVKKIADKLGWSPTLVAKLTELPNNYGAQTTTPYILIQQDAFAAMSEWYFDAVLEFSKIPNSILNPANIARAFGISEIKARLAIETLVRLDLLESKMGGGFKLRSEKTTNILDQDFTSRANINYQKGVLGKSLEALEDVPRCDRDHTSTTISIDKKDLKQAKKIIEKFRHDLDCFLQRDGAAATEVYQLQVSFFPLTKVKTTKR